MITYTARNTGTINDKKERESRGGIIIHSNKEESEALKEAIQREVEVVTGKWPSYEELKEQRAQDIADQLNRLEESTSQKEDDQSQRDSLLGDDYMGEKEAKFRSEIKKGTFDKNSMTDDRSAQQRAIDGLKKMTPRSLDAFMNPRDDRDSDIQKKAEQVWGHKTPIVNKEEQGSYECDRDGE